MQISQYINKKQDNKDDFAENSNEFEVKKIEITIYKFQSHSLFIFT